MTTETEIKDIRSALGELAKAVEELAGVVESIARGRTELSLAESAADAGYEARQIANTYR